jgi:hypothetical protein
LAVSSPICGVVQLVEQPSANYHLAAGIEHYSHAVCVTLFIALILVDTARVIELRDSSIQHAQGTFADQFRAKQHHIFYRDNIKKFY